MKRLSGYVFDSYDDVDGQVLRSIAETPSALPPIVKTAARLTEAEIEGLPDDNFALILFDGSHKLKKYATIDEGNTLLSVMYLLKQAHTMPVEISKTAAANLIGALAYHGLEVPDELKKLAKANTAVSVSGKSQKPYVGGKVHQLQYPEILEEPKESHDNPQLGRSDGAWDDVKERTNVEGTPGDNFLEVPSFPGKEKVKVAHAEAAQEVLGLFNNQMNVKQRSWREMPYFDVSNWTPTMGTTEAPAAELTLLDGQYPIDGYDQVKTASAFFEENWKDLPHRDRHRYCVKLASRMDQLGMAVPEDVRRYGSTTYASDVASYVEARRSYVHEEAHPALDLLIEKRAQVSPGVFAEALAEFDKLNDLNWHYDGKIPDAWYSTFGPSLEKVADANWRYDNDGVRISEEDLQVLARNGHERLCKSFGADFAKEFCKSPKSVFESLPAPNKLILARLASDRHSGTYTE